MRRTLWLLLAGLALGAGLLLAARGSSGPSRAGTDRATEPVSPAPPDDGVSSEDTRGRVLDDAGQCVPRAKVTLYGDGRLPPVIATVVADDAGRLPSALPRDEKGVLLVIEAKGYPRQAQRHDRTQEDITIERGTERTCVITDDAGEPLAGALVEIFAGERSSLPLGHSAADPRGVVTLRVAGEAWLLVRHPGYAQVRVPDASLPETLALPAEFTVGGRVADSAGLPLKGVAVRLQQGDDYDMALLTDADGSFLFRGAHDREGWLTASLEGYRAPSETVSPGDERIRIVMRRTASVSGVVVLPDGGAAAGADVRTTEERAETDAEGRFRLAAVLSTAQEIRAHADAMEASSRIEPEEGAELTGVRLVLRKPLLSFVRVKVSHDGQGVADASVYLQSERGLLAHTKTGPTGTAMLECREPPGTVATLHTNPHGSRLGDVVAPAVTSAGPDAMPEVEVALYARVFVRLDARGPDGAPIQAAWAQFGGDLSTCYLYDQESGCWLSPGGEYSVMVGAPGYLQRTIEGWRPRGSGDVFAVALEREAEVQGRVVVDRGATPGMIHVASDKGWAGDVSCEPDGTFRMDDFEEGRRILTIGRAAGAPEARVEVATKTGEVTDLGTITLVPAIVLTGRIVDFGGDPVGGARVEFRTDLVDENTSSHSRADGTFRIAASAIVAGTLVVQRPGLGAVRIAVAPGPSRSIGDLVLPAPGAVQFELESLASDERGKWWYLSIWWADEPDARVDSFHRGDQRRHRNDDLAPGRYVATLHIEDDRFEQEFSIAAGQTTHVTFR